MLIHKKQVLLNLLRQQQRPISLPELLNKLGAGYAERTVRRWLSEMATKGLIEKTGQKRGTRYLATVAMAPKARILKQPRGIYSVNGFSEKSKDSITYVRQPLFNRKPVTYNPAWLEAYKPNETMYMPLEIKQQLYASGQHLTQQQPAGTYARQVYNRLLIDLSYNSSRLEGNTYSLLDTEKLILEGESAPGKMDEEKIMILNHKEAIRYLVDNVEKLNVNMEDVCTLHYLLADGLIDVKYAGKIRDCGVRISQSTYIPYENTNQLKKYLTIICQKASLINDPFEQSFFLLMHIAYLQAFIDVNKRTARLSANIALIKNNVIPLSFNDIDKENYTSAMIAIYELNDFNPLLELYVYSYLRTHDLYKTTVESMGFDEIRVRYRQQRRNIIRHIIVHHLVGKAMQNYINIQVKKLIPTGDQANVLEDVKEDLLALSPSRIAGLGIDQEQLRTWLILYHKKN